MTDPDLRAAHERLTQCVALTPYRADVAEAEAGES